MTQFIIPAAVFAVVFAAVAAIGLRVIGRTKDGSQSGPGTDPYSSLKAGMRTITRVLSAVFLAFLLIVTIASYREASPHDGSYLVTGVLVIVTLMAGNWLYDLDRRLGVSASDVAVRDDFLRTVHADLAAKIGRAALDQTDVQWSVASPEVHRIDIETLERGRVMLAQGKALDEVCRAMAPEYGGWETGHQKAFQNVVRAALEHDG